MGTCLGHCFNSNSRRYDKCHSLYCCQSKYVQFDFETRKEKTGITWRCLPNSLPSFFSLRRKKEPRKEVSLELVENSWSFQHADNFTVPSSLPRCHHLDSAKMPVDLDFLTLDAKALLISKCHQGFRFAQEINSINSTPPSSLDLEWEHEASIHPQSCEDDGNDLASIAVLSSNTLHPLSLRKSSIYASRTHESRRGSTTIESLTASKDGSRMTTPDSLEWDFVDSSIPSIDPETEQLLAEIERLAANTLRETGNNIANLNEDISSSLETYQYVVL